MNTLVPIILGLIVVVFVAVIFLIPKPKEEPDTDPDKDLKNILDSFREQVLKIPTEKFCVYEGGPDTDTLKKQATILARNMDKLELSPRDKEGLRMAIRLVNNMKPYTEFCNENDNTIWFADKGCQCKSNKYRLDRKIFEDEGRYICTINPELTCNPPCNLKHGSCNTEKDPPECVCVNKWGGKTCNDCLCEAGRGCTEEGLCCNLDTGTVENGTCVCKNLSMHGGPTCDTICECRNQALCQDDGRCKCKQSYYGDKCEVYCLNGVYTNNSCECLPGYQGPSCDQETKMSKLYSSLVKDLSSRFLQLPNISQTSIMPSSDYYLLVDEGGKWIFYYKLNVSNDKDDIIKGPTVFEGPYPSYVFISGNRIFKVKRDLTRSKQTRWNASYNTVYPVVVEDAKDFGMGKCTGEYKCYSDIYMVL